MSSFSGSLSLQTTVRDRELRDLGEIDHFSFFGGYFQGPFNPVDMLSYSHGRIELYNFLVLSFPELSRHTYWKVNNGNHFLEWVWGEIDEQIVCCAAIFKDGKDAYKMGLFCVHPDYRRSGIGTMFYKYIMTSYKKVKWSTITDDARSFYRKQGAKELGPERGRDGKTYVMFSNY